MNASNTPPRPTPAALDNTGLPRAVEIVLAVLHVVLLPLAIVAGWIAMFAIANMIFGAATTPFSITMIVVSALYFGVLSMWGSGGH